MNITASTIPECFSFDDGEVIVSGEDLKISFRISRHPTGNPTGYLSLTISARWRDRELADYTPHYETAGTHYLPGEICVGDAGLLSALHQQEAGAGVDIRHGFTLQLPPAYVEPVRAALATIVAQLARESSLALQAAQRGTA